MNFFENNENSNHSLWVERYRPKELNDYIGNEMLKETFQHFIDKGDFGHLLFHGRAGGGKSTAAKMLVKNIDCDYIYINASDERNVDTVRNKIKGFASTKGFEELKVVILDESDFLNFYSQPMLRNIMETFSEHCRFILTCNYIDKIIEPIQSRCQIFQIVPPNKKEIAIHLSKILKNEDIEFNPKDLVPIIDSSYPDIRKAINTCQMYSTKGKLVINDTKLVENDYKLKVLDILKSDDSQRNKYLNCRQAIIDSRATNFSELFTLLYEKVEEYAEGSTAAVILTLAEYQQQHDIVIDKEIQMAACLIKILDIINKK